MIKNEKGFALTEILILSAVVIGVLTFMFIQFKTINRSYQKSFKYDTPEGLYLANNILNYINNDNYDALVEQLANTPEGYIDITNCDFNLYNKSSLCEALYRESGIEQIIFTKENPSKIKMNLKNFNNDMQDFIKQIKTINSESDYRIIIKYTNGTFATMRFNKGNAYVQNGLISYLDAINNTGEGHSNDTNNWKDLSGNNNDAALYNNPTWSNNSIIFDGESNCGRIENTANKDFPNGLTFETRVRLLSNKGARSNGVQEFLTNYNGSGFGIRYSSGTYRTAIHVNGAFDGTASPNETGYGTYITVAITYDNNTLKLYENGNLIKEKNINLNMPVTTSAIPIGIACVANSSIGDNNTNVEFQNILLYDRALSDNEIQRNYQADMTRY